MTIPTQEYTTNLNLPKPHIDRVIVSDIANIITAFEAIDAAVGKAGVQNTGVAVPTIASATTIAPETGIVFISGTVAIDTITVPTVLTHGGQITLIPTGTFTTTTADNIALASTAVVHKALIMTYCAATTKWYPSY